MCLIDILKIPIRFGNSGLRYVTIVSCTSQRLPSKVTRGEYLRTVTALGQLKTGLDDVAIVGQVTVGDDLPRSVFLTSAFSNLVQQPAGHLCHRLYSLQFQQYPPELQNCTLQNSKIVLSKLLRLYSSKPSGPQGACAKQLTGSQ